MVREMTDEELRYAGIQAARKYRRLVRRRKEQKRKEIITNIAASIIVIVFLFFTTMWAFGIKLTVQWTVTQNEITSETNAD